VQWVKEGQREKIPPDCPSIFAQLITLCWEMEPSKRPTTDEIVQILSINDKPTYRGNFSTTS